MTVLSRRPRRNYDHSIFSPDAPDRGTRGDPPTHILLGPTKRNLLFRNGFYFLGRVLGAGKAVIRALCTWHAENDRDTPFAAASPLRRHNGVNWGGRDDTGRTHRAPIVFLLRYRTMGFKLPSWLVKAVRRNRTWRCRGFPYGLPRGPRLVGMDLVRSE